MINLVGLSKSELVAELAKINEPAFRATQIWAWIYNFGKIDFAEMSNISKNLQVKLAEHFTVERPQAVIDNLSIDGTRKWLFKYADGELAESVHIPEADRGALCLSSQIGCTLNCTFCHTGTQKLVRNLTAADIVSQVLTARDKISEWPSSKHPRMISHLVFMGMGEPLYNYENVSKAIKIIMDTNGISISKRKITLSTSGVVPLIEKCGEELGVNLAISLHATNDALRSEIVPLNKKYPIKELLDACRKYANLPGMRYITFEYVMLKGVNDSVADAKELVRLLQGIPAKVNLIPFNPWPGTIYECSEWAQIEKFANIVKNAGYASPIRTPRGRDILAACGQLKSDSIKKTARERAEEEAAKQA